MSEDEAVILDIQRMSTEDGPGLRTTVFFKGCTLKCGWCHNPESIEFAPVVQWQKERCIGCRICLNTCGQSALSFNADGLHIDRDRCARCFGCADACPSGALTVKGKKYTVEGLFAELMKDSAYFGADGGVTLSGGEVLAQSGFAAELLKRLKAAGVRTAVDTAGNVSYEALKNVLPYTDILLYDIKIFDGEQHKKHTGAGNALLLENLIKASRSDVRIWIRTPVIPGATDSEENISAIAAFLNEHLADRVERWELCAFNNLCRSKYTMLGKVWEYRGAPLMTKEKMNRLVETAKKILINKESVRWSGAADQ